MQQGPPPFVGPESIAMETSRSQTISRVRIVPLYILIWRRYLLWDRNALLFLVSIATFFDAAIVQGPTILQLEIISFHTYEFCTSDKKPSFSQSEFNEKVIYFQPNLVLLTSSSQRVPIVPSHEAVILYEHTTYR